MVEPDTDTSPVDEEELKEEHQRSIQEVNIMKQTAEKFLERSEEADNLYKSIVGLMDWLNQAELNILLGNYEIEVGEKLDCRLGVMEEFLVKTVEKDQMISLVKMLFEDCPQEYCLTYIIQSRWDEINSWALMQVEAEERKRKRLEKEARKKKEEEKKQERRREEELKMRREEETKQRNLEDDKRRREKETKKKEEEEEKRKHLTRNRVFFDITRDSSSLGRITVQLHTEAAPETCKTFRLLCTGERGRCYKGDTFRYAAPGCLQVGLGTGGGGACPGESGKMRESGPGVLAMNTGVPWFYIYIGKPDVWGDGVNFGQVIQGMDVVRKIQFGDDVQNCGQL